MNQPPRCPKCSGACFLEPDQHYGYLLVCLQCSYTRYPTRPLPFARLRRTQSHAAEGER